MKICLIGNAQSIHMHRWAKYFIEREHKVSIVSPKGAQVEGADLHVLPYSLRRMPIAFWSVRQKIRKLKPDILCSHQANVFGLYGVLSGCRPVVIFVYGSDVLVVPGLSPLLRWMVKFAVNHADLIICESQTVKSPLLQFGVSESKIAVVPMGVDLKVFHPPNLAAGLSAPILSSIRNHTPLYNIDTILQAVKILQQHQLKLELLIAGDGPQRATLEARTKELQVGNTVEFTGRISQEEVADLLRRSVATISIPTSDSTSCAVLEAMACGALPIVSDIPANNEWVTDGANGLVVPLGSPEALAKAILRALNDHKFRKIAIKRNIEIIGERAIWEENMTKIEKRLQYLVRNSRR